MGSWVRGFRGQGAVDPSGSDGSPRRGVGGLSGLNVFSPHVICDIGVFY